MNDLRLLTIDERTDMYKNNFSNIFNVGRTHEKVRNIYNINNNKKPNPNKLIVLESYDSIKKALNNNIRFDYFILCPELAFTTEAQSIVEDMYSLCKEGYMISKKVFDYIADKNSSFGVLAVVKFPLKELSSVKLKPNMSVVILDGLEVQGNVGTIIRSCDGADVDLVILTNKRIRMSHPKFIRSSMGTCLNVPIVVDEMDNVIKWLDSNDFTIYLTDTRAEIGYDEPSYMGRAAIVAGSEKYGIMKAWYKARKTDLIKLPMLGQADSLNVGVSTSIIIYEVLKNQMK
ncbi:TrmH family RNA methyltransferase [Mycoplasmatota bacterium WC44]